MPFLASQERRVTLVNIILCQLRKETGATQPQVAQSCGISLRQYCRFEKGEQKPGCDKLIALADYFNVSLDYLVGRSSKREVADPLPRPTETESISEN